MKIDLKAKLIVSLIHLGYPDCFAVCPLSSVCMMSHFELYCNNLLPYLNPDWFLPVRRHASVSTSYGPLSVSLCVCPSQVGVLSKWLNKLGWFLAWELPSTYPTLELCSTATLLPQHINRQIVLSA